MLKSKFLVLGLFAITSFTACTVKVDSPNITVDPNINVSFPKCTATVPASMNGIVEADTPFLVEVEAKDGVAPYSIAGTTNKFASKTTVSRQYSNDTNANKVVEDFVEIRDGLSLPGTCAFSITVKPKTVVPGALSCVMAVNDASPHINTNILVTADASGGVAGSYSFSNLTLGTDGSVVTALTQASGHASAVVKYSSAGSKSINLSLTDGTSTVACVKAITVRPLVSVALVATPSNTAPTDGSITVTATPSGFVGTPTYSFYTNDPYVNIVSNGNVATLTSNTSSAHNFYIAVTASSNGESAFISIPISFTAVTPLNCTLSHPSGTYKINDSVVYTLSANTGEAVTIVDFYAGANGTVNSSTTGTRTVKYSAAGSKWASATGKVRRNNTDVFCNAGATLYDSVTIGTNTLSCNVSTSPNPSYVDQYYTQIFELNVTIPSGSGGTNPRITSVTSSSSTYGMSLYSNNTNLSRQYYFQEAGVFTVTATVRDDSNNTATCTTTHISSWSPYWWY